MKFLEMLRKSAAARRTRARKPQKNQRQQLKFESVEGRVLMAASVLGKSVASDIGAVVMAQEKTEYGINPAIAEQVSAGQKVQDILSPENVSKVVLEKVEATAKQWWADGTYFKLALEGKTPQQITGEFAKAAAQETVKELVFQGADNLTDLNTEQINAIIDAAETAIGVVTGDPTAYYNAAKLGYDVFEDAGLSILWLNSKEVQEDLGPFQDPNKVFGDKLSEALKDADIEKDLFDQYSLADGDAFEFDDPSKFEGPGEIDVTETPVNGQTGPPNPGQSTGGGDAKFDKPTEPRPQGSDLFDQQINPPVDDEGTHTGNDEPKFEDFIVDGPVDPTPIASDDVVGADDVAGTDGDITGTDDDGEDTPDFLEWYQQNEDGTWSPAKDTLNGDDPSDGDPEWWDQDYDDDEIMPDDNDDGGGTVDGGSDNDGNDDDGGTDDSGSGSGGSDDGGSDDDDTDSGGSDDGGSGDDTDSGGSDDGGNDSGGSDDGGGSDSGGDDSSGDDVNDDDGGYEDPDGITGFKAPPISDAEFLDMMLQRTTRLTTPSDPYDTGTVAQDLPMEIGKLGEDPRTVNPAIDGDTQGEEEEQGNMARPKKGFGPDPAPILYSSGGLGTNLYGGPTGPNNGAEIPTSPS